MKKAESENMTLRADSIVSLQHQIRFFLMSQRQESSSEIQVSRPIKYVSAEEAGEEDKYRINITSRSASIENRKSILLLNDPLQTEQSEVV